MNFLLSIDSSDYADKIIDTKGFLETVTFGGEMFLLGMLTVFAVLGIIWVCLNIFKFVFSGQKNTKTIEKSAVVVEDVSKTDIVESNNNDELIAVIAAAIAMAEEENQGAKFRVVSFRRK